jgi:prolipoprotein diacylglyceryl transferase
MLQYIIWDVSPDLWHTSYFTIRWYGLLFALGFLIGQQIMIHIFKKEGKPESDVEMLTVYMVLSTVIGARLGHCLFYEPKHYLSHPIEILKIWEGGLASHGATIGILFALYLYSRKKKGQSFFWIVDRIVITVALAGGLIRMGNLMNSEIIGKPADVPWAFVFTESAEEALQVNFDDVIEDVDVSEANKDTTIANEKYTNLAFHVTFKKGTVNESKALGYAQNYFTANLEDIGEVGEHIKVVAGELNPVITNERNTYEATFHVYGKTRHPAQLYEALSCFVLFLFLFWLWKKKKSATPEGMLLGIFLIYVFGLRFAFEFLKENQVAFEDNLTYNMGQLLSIPAVLGGVIILLLSLRKGEKQENTLETIKK